MVPYITTIYSFVKKVQEDWCVNLASALAYSMITVLFPVLAGSIAIVLSIINGLDIQAKNSLLQQITFLFPNIVFSKSAMSLLIYRVSKETGFIVLISFLIALFAGSRFCILLENCLDIVYAVPKRAIMKQNIIALAESLIFFIVFPFLLLISTLPSLLVHIIGPVVQLSFLTNGTAILIRGLIIFLFFCLIYKIVPNRPNTIKNIWKGALVSTLLLALLFEIFPFYADNFLRGYTGTIGLIIIILIFFYSFCFVLLIGAEINAFFEGISTQSPNEPFPHLWMHMLRKRPPQEE